MQDLLGFYDLVVAKWEQGFNLSAPGPGYPPATIGMRKIWALSGMLAWSKLGRET
jgi:hypothetical protein